MEIVLLGIVVLQVGYAVWLQKLILKELRGEKDEAIQREIDQGFRTGPAPPVQYGFGSVDDQRPIQSPLTYPDRRAGRPHRMTPSEISRDLRARQLERDRKELKEAANG